MKRLLVLILALVYMGTTTGTTMHMHFCMGKLADWSLWIKEEGTTCGKCGMEQSVQPNGCCSDEDTWVKIQDDQKAAIVAYDFSILSDAEPVHHLVTEFHSYNTACANLLPQSHAPPDISSVTVYIRNCAFLI